MSTQESPYITYTRQELRVLKLRFQSEALTGTIESYVGDAFTGRFYFFEGQRVTSWAYRTMKEQGHIKSAETTQTQPKLPPQNHEAKYTSRTPEEYRSRTEIFERNKLTGQIKHRGPDWTGRYYFFLGQNVTTERYKELIGETQMTETQDPRDTMTGTGNTRDYQTLTCFSKNTYQQTIEERKERGSTCKIVLADTDKAAYLIKGTLVGDMYYKQREREAADRKNNPCEEVPPPEKLHPQRSEVWGEYFSDMGGSKLSVEKTFAKYGSNNRQEETMKASYKVEALITNLEESIANEEARTTEQFEWAKAEYIRRIDETLEEGKKPNLVGIAEKVDYSAREKFPRPCASIKTLEASIVKLKLLAEDAVELTDEDLRALGIS